MYETWFGLKNRPFVTAPRAENYIPAEAIESARTAVRSCIERSAGPALVVGSTGAGKTTLGMVLQRDYRGRAPLAFLPGSSCRSRRTLLQALLQSFEQPHEGLDEGQMALALANFLRDRSAAVQSCLLIVDEADTLPCESLEELQAVSNLTGLGGWCVSLVLLGNSRLEEQLSLPALTSLNQRIATRCFLDDWQPADTESYITRQLSQAGSGPHQLFTPAAIQQVHQLTGGTPRLVAQLCDHAMFMSAAGGRQELDPQGIIEAWSDLQQLPPMVSPADLGGSDDDDSMVEFGVLTDGLDPAAAGARAEQRVDAIALAIAEVQDEPEVAADADGRPGQEPEPAEDGHLDLPVISTGETPVAARPHDLASAGPAWDPFQENFAEEEIVYQRPAGLRAHRNVVASTVLTDEGKALGQVLELLELERSADCGVVAEAAPGGLEQLLEVALDEEQRGPRLVASHTEPNHGGAGWGFDDLMVAAGSVAEASAREASAREASARDTAVGLEPAVGGGASAAVVTGPVPTEACCESYEWSAGADGSVARCGLGTEALSPELPRAAVTPTRRCSRLFSRLRGS